MSPVLGIIASSNQQGRGGGPVGSYDALATITVPSGGISQIMFGGIPTGYRHLELRNFVLSTNLNFDIGCRFNGDVSTNYSLHRVVANGTSTVDSYGYANQSYIDCGWTGGASTTPSGTIMTILDYGKTDKYKTTRYISGVDNNGGGYAIYESGNWRSFSAINSIILYVPGGTGFSQGSQFELYGIK